ncbi:MAG: hypothetical protein RR240_07225, partial [Burkholderiaceae bacterium]
AALAVAYLLLKNMSEEGIEIAAPGSCQRGRCGPQCKPPAEPDEDLAPQAATASERSEPRT